MALALVLALAASPAGGQPAGRDLTDAARRQDWTAVATLLRAGADVDQRQGDGASALHWAVYWDAPGAVRLLLAAGAAVDAANDLGVTPLWLAAGNGNAAVVEALLARGADPGRALPAGETPLMTAARNGSPAAVRALLAHGADPHAAERAHRQTALMWAVAQRHPEVVRVLLQFGARVEDRSRAYPQVVSSSGNADPSGVFEVLQGGYTPLLFAARHGDLASARLLVAAGAAVDGAAASGATPLVVAAHGDHGDLAAFLLEAGAEPDAAGAGYAALHAAVLRGNLPLVRTLLAFGADPDAVLQRGTPARRVSADWRLPHRLIGATPFWVAAYFREPAIMGLLVAHGADPRAAVGGETAAMAAIKGSSTRRRLFFGAPRPASAVEARRARDAVAAALDAGVDVNARGAHGDMALHLAVARRLDGVAALLAERGAALDARNGRRETPLHLAVARRLDGVVALLAERGAALDARNGRGETPLDLALADSNGTADAAAGGIAALLRALGATAQASPPAAAR